jgi:hypothetical protein
VSPLIDALNKQLYGSEAKEGALCAALGQLGDSRAMDVLNVYAWNKLGFQSVQNAAQAALAKIDPSYVLKRREEEEKKGRAEEEKKKRAEEEKKKRAGEEKKRRAEEDQRRQAQDERRARRQSLGLCINCGGRMNFVQKLFGKDKHGGCTAFKD